jgi:hypothetical protein
MPIYLVLEEDCGVFCVVDVFSSKEDAQAFVDGEPYRDLFISSWNANNQED